MSSLTSIGFGKMNKIQAARKRIEENNADFVSFSPDVDKYTMYDKDMVYKGSVATPRIWMDRIRHELLSNGWVTIKTTASSGQSGHVLSRTDNG